MNTNSAPAISLSIVSHGQGKLIRMLLSDLERLEPRDFEVIVTVNIPEDESVYAATNFRLHVLRNATPKGFGANHNAAFEQSTGEFFAVVNPDIRAPQLNLAELRKPFDEPRTGAVAPLVVNSRGCMEDSARRFPSWRRLARRVLLRDREPDYRRSDQPAAVDWVAGMFVVFRRDAFREVRGFDARRFFMYYEDVDICARLQLGGWTVRVQPSTRVVHDAQRASHRSLKYLRWHVTSAVRYLTGL